MRRREFIAGIGGAAAWPVVVRGQQQALPVVGGLYSGTAHPPKLKEAFLQGLREQGYSDGRNVTIEDRFADNQYDRLPALASDLVGRRVSVIVAYGFVPALAAKKATNTIPIVFGVGADPVKSGLVTSFNKPNGNATGVAQLNIGLETASQIIPHILCEGLVQGVSLTISATVSDLVWRRNNKPRSCDGEQGPDPLRRGGTHRAGGHPRRRNGLPTQGRGPPSYDG
jgi:ABC transporter substrate binding protein